MLCCYVQTPNPITCTISVTDCFLWVSAQSDGCDSSPTLLKGQWFRGSLWYQRQVCSSAWCAWKPHVLHLPQVMQSPAPPVTRPPKIHSPFANRHIFSGTVWHSLVLTSPRLTVSNSCFLSLLHNKMCNNSHAHTQAHMLRGVSSLNTHWMCLSRLPFNGQNLSYGLSGYLVCAIGLSKLKALVFQTEFCVFCCYDSPTQGPNIFNKINST